MTDTYKQPKNGWVCFHCGEVFKKYGAARDHFGARPEDETACRIKAGEELGLVMKLRKAEKIIRLSRRLLDELVDLHESPAF